MTLFMSKKKREQIGDQIDDLMMKQYYKRCNIEEAKENGNEQLVTHEQRRIEEIEEDIIRLRKKLS